MSGRGCCDISGRATGDSSGVLASNQFDTDVFN